MLTFITIHPHQRGVIIDGQRPARWLEPGRHALWAWRTVERLDLTAGFAPFSPELAAAVPEQAADEVEVPLAHRGLLRVDGLPSAVLPPGRYLLWKVRVSTQLTLQDTRDVACEIPAAFLDRIPATERWSATIQDATRGLLVKDGRLVRLLPPGAHHLWDVEGSLSMTTTNLTVEPHRPELARLLSPEQATVLTVAPDQFALYAIDGQPRGVLSAGRYILWQLQYAISAQCYSTVERFSTVPRPSWPLLGSAPVTTQTIKPYQRGLLYVDGQLVEELAEGAYAINSLGRDVSMITVDMREQELLITGQEVMTADKVSLRVSMLMTYRVTDARLSVEATTDLSAALYSAVQLAARRTIAGLTVDHLLEKRNEVRGSMRADLAASTDGWGVSIQRLDLKDISLPGEMKTIFNQVIEARKRAAANVITRREETAATRSLANTAKMLEDNPTLLRLKELETLKEMAGQIGELTVMATPDQLLQSLRLR